MLHVNRDNAIRRHNTADVKNIWYASQQFVNISYRSSIRSDRQLTLYIPMKNAIQLLDHTNMIIANMKTPHVRRVRINR